VTKTTDRFLCAAWLLLSALYLWRWDIFFNSDFSIVGLTARQTLKTGELFIFIPGTGYQGLLLCSTATALFYSILGFAPWVLNLWPTVVFLALLPAFQHAVGLWHGQAVARLAAFCLLFSPPLFHHLVLRSHPNLGEVILLGCLLFSLLHPRSRLKNARFRFLFAGLISGFGTYLAGQFLFFIAALLVWLASRRPLGRPSRKNPLASVIYLLLIVAISGSILWLFGIRMGPLRTDQLELFVQVGLLALGLQLVRVAREEGEGGAAARAIGLRSGMAFAFGCVAGYSPKLFFNWILHGASIGRTRISGSAAEVLQRLDWLLEGWRQSFWGELRWEPVALMAAGLYGCLLVLGAVSERRRRPFSPFMLLPAANAIACLFGSAFVSASCFWYFVPAFAGLAVLNGKALLLLWQRSRWTAVAAGLIYFGYFGSLIITDFTRPTLAYELTSMHTSKAQPARALIEAARSRELAYGYANYDFAYATTLLSEEKVTIAPLQAAFLPWIGDRVAASDQFFILTTPEESQDFTRSGLNPHHNHGIAARHRSAVQTHSETVDLDGQAWVLTQWKVVAP
jgi:hypothetical protein